MFYDPTCKPEVKTNPLSLEALIAWLETKPSRETYSYVNGHACLLAQYLKAQGFEDVYATSHRVVSSNRSIIEIPSVLNDIVFDRGVLCADKDYTFGGALKRARKAEATRAEVRGG